MSSIDLHKVSVSFPIYSAGSRSFKNRLMAAKTGGSLRAPVAGSKVTVVEALNDVDLHLGPGERIGLIGHNGAGKTTLLRVLAGIYEPTSGSAQIHGRTVPLFDISLGMDLESTGYENIMLRGLFLGHTREEIRAHTDDIAEFTELGEFLDLPMRTYSDGMKMRLAFAVSTSVAPEILLIDEGIGAGDASFIERANARLAEFTRKVEIIVLSSHNEALIESMCATSLLMSHGRVVEYGETGAVLETYRRMRSGG